MEWIGFYNVSYSQYQNSNNTKILSTTTWASLKQKQNKQLILITHFNSFTCPKQFALFPPFNLFVQLFPTLMKPLSTLLLITIFTQILSQKCIDNNGNNVSWWLMINTPKKTPSIQYLYFDSSFTTPNFSLYTDDPSSTNTALARTLTQINTLSLQTIAWNDDKPNGATSSTSAHSKMVIAQNSDSSLGFILDHSLPEYPAFSSNIVNVTIDANQKIYGQHLFCMSLPASMIDTIASNLRTIKAYIYQSNIPSSSIHPNIYALGSGVSTPSLSNFQTFDFTLDGFSFKSIYKNGNNSKNCSMFQDGLNNYLNDSLYAETWGRPLDAAWCGSPMVNNVKTVGINSTVSWLETQDHSKWAITQNKNWSCFGDMNRMKSQWKRGGAFYCLEHALLNTALKSIITTDTC